MYGDACVGKQSSGINKEDTLTLGSECYTLSFTESEIGQIEFHQCLVDREEVLVDQRIEETEKGPT